MYHGGVRWWRRHWLLICLPCVRRTSFSSSSNFKLCSILIKSLLLQVTIVFCVGFNFLSNKHEQRNTCKSSYLCVHFFTNKQLTQQFMFPHVWTVCVQMNQCSVADFSIGYYYSLCNLRGMMRTILKSVDELNYW